MATIDDLRKSITEMSDEELFNLHREVRQSRRTKKGTTKSSSKKKEVDVVGMAKSLSEDDRRRLIEELEGTG